MLDDLNELRTFQRVLECGSLSAAARDLGVGLAVVSKRLMALERRAGQRLIHRTTRTLSATDEGLALLGYVDRMLEELAAAESRMAVGAEEPYGLLRVSSPISFGRIHLVPLVAELVERHPKLDVELRLDDRLMDLTNERIDVAVRIGQPRDSSAVMRKIANSYRILVAAPAYLDRHGEPKAVGELDRHLCLRYDDRSSPWRLEGPKAEVVEIDAPQFTEEFRQAIRARFARPIIVAGLYDKARAEWVLSKGYADLVAFGRPFVANPDLPRRLAEGLPPASLDGNALYGGGEHGYTDYPSAPPATTGHEHLRRQPAPANEVSDDYVAA